MPDARQHPSPTAHEVLALHAREVDVARSQLRATRTTGSRPAGDHLLRSELLDALENYASAITRFGGPVPYRLHAEIELYRGLRNRS